MTREASLDLLDDTHSFPGRFTFKAIGKADDEFGLRVVAAVRKTLEQEFDAPYELRPTASGRHVSVTVEAWVDSSSNVIDVYDALKAVDGLVLLL